MYRRKALRRFGVYGRFPHRNRALGRESSAQETQWFASAGKSYGQ
jgi:uncharacterized protein (DUF924 family)